MPMIAALRARWLTLEPESWRNDLLMVVLRVTAVLGTLVYVPSVLGAMEKGVSGVLVVDTVAIVTILALVFVRPIPRATRTAVTCFVFYLLGAGLLLTVGSISQIYLFAFSLLTTLLAGFRRGITTVVINAVTMLVIGTLGIASPEMGMARWSMDLSGWFIVTANFAFINVSLVLALGTVVAALERALQRAAMTREALEREGHEMFKLNASLAAEVRERCLSEQSLQESRALLRIAGRTARLGGWRVDRANMRIDWSDEVCELHEVPVGAKPTIDEAMGFFTPASRQMIMTSVRDCFRAGTPFDVEAQIVTAAGTPLWVRAIGNQVRGAGGRVTQVSGSIQDITPQKVAEARAVILEERFRQTQKMETIGNLAGGIAHDFNNLMSIVLSYSDMLLEDMAPEDPVRADLQEIRGAGLRAANLTRQLLAFSRQQVLEPRIIDLSQVVQGMEGMLRRLIGEDIELATCCPSSLSRVLVDPTQIEQVILNLAANARDAMPTGGTLTIETSVVVLDDRHDVEDGTGIRGRSILLAVSDTGTGVDAATQRRMFEPFFTTKEVGKGTGLGLATVQGIVRQSGGTILVHSEPGLGTSFKVYFPVVAAPPSAASHMPIARAVPGAGTANILVVEDEEKIRTVVCAVLRKNGYQVLEASNGTDALRVSEGCAHPIDLLLTDVVMPNMGGRQLAEQLGLSRPDMRVLYMSGYTDDAIVRHGVLDSQLEFIQKPVSPGPLTRKVREVLASATV